MGLWASWGEAARRLQWRRGLRAGLAVAVAMAVCRMLGKPMGWAALGGFEAILVDNGGPYRSRLQTMATVLVGGAVACVVGAMSATPLAVAVVVTAAFCFVVTFARVLSQPIASTSVIVLVLYFAGYGGTTHTLEGALGNALAFVLGGAWAAALSLVFWPVDPFRPARLAVAECYRVLAEFAAGVKVLEVPRGEAAEEREAGRRRIHAFQREMRTTMETARSGLSATAARTTSRTVRARSLTVLLETADMLFAETLRWAELAEAAEDGAARDALREALHWMSAAERAVAGGLTHRPQDGGSSFAPEGSHSLEHVRGRAEVIAAQERVGTGLVKHLVGMLVNDERDALQNIEIAFEALRAVWSGVEVRAGGVTVRWSSLAERDAKNVPAMGWLETARANWTASSVMMRHALRLAVVGAVDVLLMRMVHVSHGSWLAMTSIIVLQPYGSGTVRRSMQRVVGTIAGGVLAAVLAAGIQTQEGILVVITVTSVLTLATYAVDYGWYCFFLTPTFVLMSLPQLRDWHYAGVRMGTTVLGALVALVAMRLLWPEQEQAELSRLLGTGAIADAEYVTAMVKYWELDAAGRRAMERTLLAPARRSCGLAINDAEETLDRLMLEPGFGKKAGGLDGALTFVTYLRRLARSVTVLTVVGTGSEAAVLRLERVAVQLRLLSTVLLAGANVAIEDELPATAGGEAGVAEQQIRRMERQVQIMERAAAELVGTASTS